jgi:hypothetical protein
MGFPVRVQRMCKACFDVLEEQSWIRLDFVERATNRPQILPH